MGGTYADVPAPRLAYHRDGTRAVTVDFGVASQRPTSWLETLNNESDDLAFTWNAFDGYGQRFFVLLFPEPRDVSHAFMAVNNLGGNGYPGLSLWTSPDTTTGVDGSWTPRTPGPLAGAGRPDRWRTGIWAAGWNGIRGMRFEMYDWGNWNHNNGLLMLHLYGQPSAIADRQLRLWHPTIDTPLGGADGDFDDIDAPSSSVRDFRVKNNSSWLTARSVIVGLEVLTDAPTVPLLAQLALSVDGGATWHPSIELGDLAPGAISDVVSVRWAVHPEADLSVWAATAVPTAVAGWSSS